MTLTKEQRREHLAKAIAIEEKRLAEHKARLRLLNAQAKAKEDKDENRRKILIGAAVLAAIRRPGPAGDEWREKITRQLDTFLTRPSDRAVMRPLFDLSEFAPNTAEGVAAAVAADKANGD